MGTRNGAVAGLIRYTDYICEYEVRGPDKARVEKKCKAKVSTARQQLQKGNSDAAVAHAIGALQLVAWADGKAGYGNIESYD